jgi:pyridoxine 5-phosphate synthase
MIDLAVHLDALVALRTDEPPAAPEISALAAAAVFGGADRLVVRLRTGREPVRDRDVRVLRETALAGLELEIAGDSALIDPVLETHPERLTLVGREGPIDTTQRNPELVEAIDAFLTAELAVGVLIPPESEAVLAAQGLGVRFVRLDTGGYARAAAEDRALMAFRSIDAAARTASEVGLRVSAGGGLTLRSVRRLIGLASIEQIVVGRAIVARAVFIGLEAAVREVRDALDAAERQAGGGLT